jgi:hypothetical protein
MTGMAAGKKTGKRAGKKSGKGAKKAKAKAQSQVDAASLLRFKGGRFEQKAGQVGFPLDAISELQRYQTLVVEYAKRIWREQNPKRKRLPSDFESKVRLRLSALRPGSVYTDLVAEPTLALPDSPNLLEQSLDATEEALRSIAGGKYDLPAAASDELIRALRGIGKNLAPDETVVYRPTQSDSFAYGRKEHDAFWKALEADVKRREGLLLGKLNRLAADYTFTIVDPEGREIEGTFTASEVWDTLHELHKVAQDAELVWLDAVYEIDMSDGRVVKINDVQDANLFARGDNKWASRLMRFAALQPGWASHGDGERIGVASLQLALEVLNHVTAQHKMEPGLFASPEGGVRMEWLTDTSHTVLTVDDDAHFFAYFVNDQTDEEVSEEPIGAPAAIAFVDRFVS